MTQSENYPMIAKTMAELEDVLAEELIALGANDVEIGTRMVSFTGDKRLMYKANVHCRTALRILKPIYNFKAENADEVYDALKQINWEDYLSLDKTFSIDAVVFSHIFNHSKFVAYKVKDAIADWFADRYEKRPSVSVTNPDIVFNIHVAHNKCTLSLDSSGESLHKRGYRIAQTEAPLNEVLAAGMILKSGWRGESVFVDPMCGSGTLLIEAAMIALGIPPGIHRQNFGFEKWNDFDEELFSEVYNDDSGSREFSHRIIGSDISPKAIAICEKNVRNAGLKKYIDLSVKPFQQYVEAPAPHGVLITNPPYGERIKVEELSELYSMIGERLKHVFTGYDAYILSYKKESFDSIGLKHSRRFFLFNGALECEMREYEIFSGKRDERPVRETPHGKGASAGDRAYSERNSKEGYRRSKRAQDGASKLQSESYDTRHEEKPRNTYRRKRVDEGWEPGLSFQSEQGQPSRSDKPFKLRKPASHSDHSFKSGKPSHFDKPFKPDRSSDKSFKSRERSTSREDRREPRSDNTGAKSFKSGKNFSGKEAKPCDSRKRNSREK